MSFPPLPHDDSRSESNLFIRSETYWWRCKLQSLSLIEERPSLDEDGDGILSAAELEAGHDWIVDFVASHWSFGPRDWANEPEQDFGHIESLPIELDGFGFPRYQWLEVSWSGAWDAAPTVVEYAHGAFLQTSPGHRDTLTYHWDGHGVQTATTLAGESTLVLQPGLGLTHLSYRATAQELWLDGGLLMALVALWAVYCGSSPSVLRWAALLGTGAAWLGFFLELPNPSGNLWRTWLLPGAFAYGLLDRYWQPKASPFWPSILWGVVLAGAWNETWQQAWGSYPPQHAWAPDNLWIWPAPALLVPAVPVVLGLVWFGSILFDVPKVKARLGIAAGVWACVWIAQRMALPFFGA